MTDKQLHKIVSYFTALNAGGAKRAFVRMYGQTMRIELNIYARGWDGNRPVDRTYQWYVNGRDEDLSEVEEFVKEVCNDRAE